MSERFKYVSQEAWNYFLSIILPALAGIAISISIKMKSKRVKFIHVFLSLVIGVLTAYLTGKWILHHTSPDLAPPAIAVVTILGEKIGYWLVFKFKVDTFLEALVRSITKDNK